MNRLGILLALFLMPFALSATITVALDNGDWNDGSNWSNGEPGCGDTIVIPSAFTVTVTDHVNLDENSTPACNTPSFIYVYGTLHFQSGKKMYLACGSGVVIAGGPPPGQVTAGGGGGNSNLIDICQTTVWNAGSGDQSGPLVWGTDPVLPIELVSFEAHINENVVDIKWVTASESNNDFFTIERSKDGQTIEEVEIVDGAGTSTSILTYFIKDYEPWIGISYYRLKQTDFDGRFSYSEWVPVDYDGQNGPGIELFPNPVRTEETFTLGLTGFAMKEVVIVVRDITGKEFFSKVVVASYNDELVAIDPQGRIPAGNYLITATSDNAMYSKKLVVYK